MKLTTNQTNKYTYTRKIEKNTKPNYDLTRLFKNVFSSHKIFNHFKLISQSHFIQLDLNSGVIHIQIFKKQKSLSTEVFQIIPITLYATPTMKKVFRRFKDQPCFQRKIILYFLYKYGILKPCINFPPVRRCDLGVWQT